MSSPAIQLNTNQRMPGPVTPGFARIITQLSPVRLPFDSLKYVIDNGKIYGRLWSIYFGDNVTIVISDPDLIHEILVARHDEFQKSQQLRDSVGNIIGNGLLLSEGDFWKRQRKLAQPAFHMNRIASYGTTMTQHTLDLLSMWRDGETRDIAHDMMTLALGIVNKTLFGMDVRAQSDRIGELMHTILEGANDRLIRYAPFWERLTHSRAHRERAAREELFAIVERIIAEHRNMPDNGDLLSMLLAARDDDGQPMSDRQLRDEVITLFIAGHETTANLLAFALWLVSENRHIEDKLLREIATLSGTPPAVADLAKLPYVEMTLKEAMRLYPPAAGAAREPIHDLEMAGYRIPRGAQILISSYSMHRDPALFVEPDKFDPERFSAEREAAIPKFAYLPFGGGPRVCIGNAFAMMEARLALTTMLQRYQFSLAPNTRVQTEQLFTIRPKGGLKMVVRKR